MNRLLQLLVCIFLCTQSLICGAKEDGVFVMKSIPKAECVNPIIDGEIRHYLAQQDTAKHQCYWSIRIEKNNNFCICQMFRVPGNIPCVGTAYLQYGNDIVVIAGKYDRKLFHIVKGHNRTIKMSKKAISFDESFAYLGLEFFNGRLSNKYSIYDACR